MVFGVETGREAWDESDRCNYIIRHESDPTVKHRSAHGTLPRFAADPNHSTSVFFVVNWRRLDAQVHTKLETAVIHASHYVYTLSGADSDAVLVALSLPTDAAS